MTTACGAGICWSQHDLPPLIEELRRILDPSPEAAEDDSR